MKLVDAVGHVLHEHPFFTGLTEEQKELVTGCASLLMFPAGTFIYREDRPAENFYFIRQGRVALEVYVPGRAPIIVDTLREGDPLGWSWLIPPYETHFDARALELTRVICFNAGCLRGKMDQDPAFGYQLLSCMVPVIASRLAAARRRLIDLYGRPDPKGATWR
jgi:CRP-like cAMP-binding protein